MKTRNTKAWNTKAYHIAFTFGLACIAALSPLVRAQTAAPPTRVALDSHRSLGGPQTFRNLTLIPVYDSRATTGNPYITLDEGLKSGLVTVRESANGGEVNTLYLTNKSNKPLYLMAGEVVLGGQQDRCIGNDALVKAGTRKLPITVFCVEHGRWTGEAHFAQSALTVASADIRASAQAGAFSEKMASVATVANNTTGNAALGQSRAVRGVNGRGGFQANVRLSTQNPQTMSSTVDVGVAQQQVWDKVAAKNRRFKTESQSGTYRTMLNLAGGEAQHSVVPYIKALSAAPGNDSHLVGTVAAINGKVVAADIFGSPSLFRKLWPKLLRSYAADAAEHAQPGKNPSAVTVVAAQRFLQQAANGKNKVDAGGVTGVNTRLDAPQTVLYRLTGSQAKAVSMPALHENVLSK
jgi:hypothetical protein